MDPARLPASSTVVPCGGETPAPLVQCAAPGDVLPEKTPGGHPSAHGTHIADVACSTKQWLPCPPPLPSSPRALLLCTRDVWGAAGDGIQA
eukprot:10606469-Prorocentrum_lima.AAC.1